MTSNSGYLAGVEVQRVGFGAMQLPGPGVFGPPRDHDAALAVLRRAIELGVNHIDTSQYYGPDVSNALIREALAVTPRGFEHGVNHSDTSQHAGPDVPNALTREALPPYPADLVLVSKV